MAKRAQFPALGSTPFFHERTWGEGRGGGAHLFPVNGVRSGGLGLALPLHLVSEHDDLGLVGHHAHWVDVWVGDREIKIRTVRSILMS